MNKNTDHSDEALLDQLQQRNGAAFEAVYNYYWPVMYSHALRMLQHETEAEDMVQELFIAFYERLPQLAANTRIDSYLFVSLRRRILNHIRNQRVRAGHLESLGRYAEQARNTTLEQLHEKELAEQIEREIARMPARMKEIFELSRKVYLTHREIAEKLAISDKTVKTQVNNALKTLRGKLGFLAALFG